MRPPTLAHSARRPPPLCASRAIAPDRYTERSAEIWSDWLKSGKAIGRPYLHRDPPSHIRAEPQSIDLNVLPLSGLP